MSNIPSDAPTNFIPAKPTESMDWDGGGNDAVGQFMDAVYNASEIPQEVLEAGTEEEAPVQDEQPIAEEPVEQELAPTEVPTVDTTPRAQKRIQQLVEQKKDTESKLELALAQLAQVQQQQLMMQQQEQMRRQQREMAEQERMREESFDNEVRNLGYNPLDPAHQAAIQNIKETYRLRQEHMKLQHEVENMRAHQYWSNYSNQLQTTLETMTKDLVISPETKNHIQQIAYSFATQTRNPDVNQVLQAVAVPILKDFPKKTTTTKPQAPANAPQALKAVATKAAPSKPKQVSSKDIKSVLALFSTKKSNFDLDEE